MFANLFVVSSVILALASQVLGHAAVAPMLGVKGTPKRSDVERPTAANPCGRGVNIARLLDSSDAVALDASNKVSLDALNFNGGADGSLSFNVKFNTDGTGKQFDLAKMLVNGPAAPPGVQTQQLSLQLPAGTKCTGGAAKNKCLLQLITTAGFGNCVVVQQGAGGAKREDTDADIPDQADLDVGGTLAPRALLARGGEVVKRKASQWIWA